MRKLFLFIVAFMILSLVGQVAAEELELGISLFPIGMLEGDKTSDGSDQSTDDQMYQEEKSFMEEWLVGLHVAYNWGFVYASLDSMVMPSFLVEELTRKDRYDEGMDQYFIDPGIAKPGFYNFIDAGLKLTLGQIVTFVEAGVNYLYIYKQDELQPEDKPGALGVNLRAGAGYKVTSNLSVGVTGTAIFPDFATMGDALKGLIGEEGYAGAKENIQVLPMLMVVLYL